MAEDQLKASMRDKVWAWMGFDTETSGLFRKGEPPTAPGQPRLAALSILRCTPGFAITSQELYYVKPDGWQMEPDATAVNGLTNEFLHEHGRPIREVLDAYVAAIDEGRAQIAFNLKFDQKVMRAELRRAQLDDRFFATPGTCVMLKSIGVCKVPAEGRRGYRTPKLWEALGHFRLPVTGAHTACGDAIGAVQIARMLSQIGIDLTPEYPTKRPRDEQAEEGGRLGV